MEAVALYPLWGEAAGVAYATAEEVAFDSPPSSCFELINVSLSPDTEKRCLLIEINILLNNTSNI